MASRLWTRIVKDWENQPLAIIGQAVSIAVALSLTALGAASASLRLSAVQPLTDASYALAVTVLTASISAGISRYGFRNSFITGFCLSLTLASACLLLFSVLGSPYLIKTTKLVRGSYDGPLMDIGYWAVFLVFLVACSSAGIDRLVLSSQALKSSKEDDQKQERGVTVLEVTIVAFIWGACLSGVQQKVVAAFVF